MFYTIYKTTNNINGKIYIGKHKTQDLDDNYLGSGTILKRVIKKHGINNFTKEYLFIFDNEEDMNSKELELVNESFIKEDTNYNLKLGGEGGWDYNNIINPHSRDRCGIAVQDMYRNNKEKDIKWRKHLKEIMLKRDDLSEHMDKMIDAAMNKYPEGIWKGKKHTKETKLKMSKSNTHMKGSNNSQYGMMWIYSLEEKISKRIKKDEIVPEGWYKGRKIKF